MSSRRSAAGRIGFAALGLWLALGLAVAGGCEVSRTRICEGQPVGTFQLRADVLPDDASCPFAPDGGRSFTATVAFGSDASAVLCIDRPDAEPLRGTHVGDHVVVSSQPGTANVDSCTCGVLVVESVEGDVTRTDGVASGFTGELRNAFSPAAEGASCEPDAGAPDAAPRCAVPCGIRWQLLPGS